MLMMLLLPSTMRAQATQTVRGQVSDVASGGVANGISIHGNSPQMLQWRVEGVEEHSAWTSPLKVPSEKTRKHPIW